jgi:hypothetical protein
MVDYASAGVPSILDPLCISLHGVYRVLIVDPPPACTTPKRWRHLESPDCTCEAVSMVVRAHEILPGFTESLYQHSRYILCASVQALKLEGLIRWNTPRTASHSCSPFEPSMQLG